MTISPSQYIARFIDKEQLTEDTFTFRFKKPEGFDFLPGQYNRWSLPIDNPDERGTSRYFTIASNPLDKEFINITTRVIQSSFKIKLSRLTAGDEVGFFGPLGNFVLDEEDPRPKIFLAGGIGITPYYSMLKYARQKNLSNKITLIASFSTKEEIIFYEELSDVSRKFPNIKVIYTLTKENIEGFESGRISEEMIKKYADLSASVFYMVGPPAMVSAMEGMTLQAGIPQENIKVENFTGY